MSTAVTHAGDSAFKFDESQLQYGKSYEEKQDDARKTLVALYTKYNPQKLKDVDTLLEAYAGQEDELVASVRQKYEKKNKPQKRASAPSRALSAPVGGAKTPPGRGRAFSSPRNGRIEGFGNNLPVVQEKRRSFTQRFLRRKKDDPDRELFAQYDNKKGLRSSSLPPPRKEGRLGGGNMHQDTAERISKHQNVREEFSLEIKNLDTGESETIGAVNKQVTQQNKGIGLRNLRGRDRFVAFFQKYDPPLVAKVDELITYGGRTEEQLWLELQVKYKVNQRGRLLALLKIFEPKNAKRVDEILLQHRGQEEELISALMLKYRPAIERMEPDPKTWKTGAENTYQVLPGRDLGD